MKEVESNQLRLGNWVLLDWENTYRRVNLNTLCYITRSEKLGKKHPFKPIPLTEEIFFKSETFLKGYINFDFKENMYVFKYFDLEVKLPYVHTFQNFVYGLIGKELTITL